MNYRKGLNLILTFNLIAHAHRCTLSTYMLDSCHFRLRAVAHTETRVIVSFPTYVDS